MMQFSNPIVGGTELVRDAIQSPNFTPTAGWQINRDGSATFNNLTTRGGLTVSSTNLYYNGTPALGNLIASISEAAGTDAYGNNYLSGITSYDYINGIFAQIEAGGIRVGGINSGIPDLINNARILANSAETELEIDGITPHGILGANTAKMILQYQARPLIAILDKLGGGSEVDLTLSGAALPTNTVGILLQTTTVGATGAPAYNTNWSGNTTYGTLGTVESLSFNKTGTGHVHVHGAFKTDASAPTSNTVFTLPTGYYRTDRVQLFTWHARIAPNNPETIGTGVVYTDGTVSLSSTNTNATSVLVANSTFWMEFFVDGPNVK